MYLDSAYIAKFYVNEADAAAVRRLIAKADELISSAWAAGEVACAFHRHMREGALNQRQFQTLLDAFQEHVKTGVWVLMPVTENVLSRTASLIRMAARDVYLRAGDAVHLATALEAGEHEIWTSDRHLLAAANRLGLAGRHV